MQEAKCGMRPLGDATRSGWSSPSDVVALVTNAVLETEPCSIALASPLRRRERVLDHVLATVVTPQVGHGSARLWSTLSVQQPLWCRTAVRANAAAANGRKYEYVHTQQEAWGSCSSATVVTGGGGCG
jgi:hypothetical protein